MKRIASRTIAFLGSITLASVFGFSVHSGDRGHYSLFSVAHADTPNSGSQGGDSVAIGCDSCCGASNANGDPGSGGVGEGGPGGGDSGGSSGGDSGGDGACACGSDSCSV